MKNCKNCQVPKSFEEFHKNSQMKCGRGNICKICDNKRSNDHYNENKKQIKDAYANRSPKSKAERVEYMAQYHLDNKDMLNVKSADYRAKNKDKNKDKAAQYYQKNKLRLKEKYDKNKPVGRTADTYPYKDQMLSIKQILELPECKYSRPTISSKLKEGLSLDEILLPPTKEELEAAQKILREKRAQKRAQDKAIIKESKEDIKRQRALKIMSTPITEKATYVYWVLKNYTHSSDSFMGEPIRLSSNGGY